MDDPRRAILESALAHWREVFVFANQLIRDRGVAEDLAQEAYLRLHASDAPLDASRPLRPLLFTIVRNLVRSRMRRRAAGVGAVDCDDLLDDAPTPPAASVAREERTALSAVLDGMRPSWRAALYLADGLDCSYAEIATCLGVSEDTVRTTLHRARAKVRAALERREARIDGADHERR